MARPEEGLLVLVDMALLVPISRQVPISGAALGTSTPRRGSGSDDGIRRRRGIPTVALQRRVAALVVVESVSSGRFSRPLEVQHRDSMITLYRLFLRFPQAFFRSHEEFFEGHDITFLFAEVRRGGSGPTGWGE